MKFNNFSRKLAFPKGFIRSMMGLALTGVTLAAFAEVELGGLNEGAGNFVESITKGLQGLGIAIMGISIAWSGYKFMFKKGEITECAQIAGGGFLVGGAVEIASMIMGAFS